MNREFILLPRVGVRATGPAAAALRNIPFATSTSPPLVHALEATGGRDARIIDTISEDGPKLVELDDEAAQQANRPDSPLRAVPVVTYDRPNPPLRALSFAATSTTTLTVTCEDAVTSAPIEGVLVVAFTDFDLREGDEGRTNGSGQVRLSLRSQDIERLYAYAPAGYWGAFRRDLSVSTSLKVPIEPVDLTYQDAVRRYYGNSAFRRDQGVVVGVLDSGIGPHLGLNVVGGHNTVTGEPAGDFDDPDSHGTHVAGLIGANQTPPAGLRGVAPGVDLRAFRVFPATGGGATNYAILKAMILAAQDGCDIINLSLGGGPFDWIVEEAIQDARNQGMLVVVAAGNDGRRPVNYPAAYSGATAISAMGHEDTFPRGSLFDADVDRPPHSSRDAREFLAEFSNIGPEIAMTGLGVGVLSTLPNDQFGPMSGTSMAAPVVAGCAASLLSQDPTLLAAVRDRARSDAIERLIQTSCVRRQFGTRFEGYGLPDPAVV